MGLTNQEIANVCKRKYATYDMPWHEGGYKWVGLGKKPDTASFALHDCVSPFCLVQLPSMPFKASAFSPPQYRVLSFKLA